MPGMVPPANPAIYHITHVSNLAGMLRDGCIWSDSQRIVRGVASTNIGYPHIKQRRLSRPVPVAARGALGDYVPFNFCFRSVMLFVIANGHAGYGGGQDDIVHLASSVSRAAACGMPWAFTERHADLAYAQFFDRMDDLEKIDWTVMPLTYWAVPPETKERRQAEFLYTSGCPGPRSRGLSCDPRPLPIACAKFWRHFHAPRAETLRSWTCSRRGITSEAPC